MITDNETNFLYLADTLQKKQPTFFSRFEKVLNDNYIKFDLLPHTKDYWAVDFMPIQIHKNDFIRFVYNPDYLQKHKHLISDVDSICNEINLTCNKSEIVVDGGNVVRGTGKVIMCDKVFKENPIINKGELITQLLKSFEFEELIFIPTNPQDEFGHADGMVRFLNSDTVLINAYSDKDKELKDSLKSILKSSRLNWIEIPYNPYQNKTLLNAKGIYINYLQMKDVVFIPTFNMKEDNETIRLFEQLFKEKEIIPVDSREIAKEGGILNCITWNILRD
jgi:agmatine deiminase